MDRERFERQISFILEADKEKNVFRRTHITGMHRLENDAEHAWHMAMMVYLLKEYAPDEFDTAKAMMMALIHDVVEIDAGDTYAYDDASLATQKDREEAAAERIFALLPEDQATEMRSLFDEFEAGVTPEARFARAMDNLQPLLLNNANEGVNWRYNKVKRSQVMNRQSRTKPGSEDIWRYSVSLVEENVKKGNISEG